jgi:hypothetical protein
MKTIVYQYLRDSFRYYRTRYNDMELFKDDLYFIETDKNYRLVSVVEE